MKLQIQMKLAYADLKQIVLKAIRFIDPQSQSFVCPISDVISVSPKSH